MVNQYNNVNQNTEHSKIVKQAIAELMPTQSVPANQSKPLPEAITIRAPKAGKGFFTLGN